MGTPWDEHLCYVCMYRCLQKLLIPDKDKECLLVDRVKCSCCTFIYLVSSKASAAFFIQHLSHKSARIGIVSVADMKTEKSTKSF